MAQDQHYGADPQTGTFWARCPRCGVDTTGHKDTLTPFRFLYVLTCDDHAEISAERALLAATEASSS
jgi:hypothetical protein